MIMTDYILSKQRTFSVRHIYYSHSSHKALQARVQETQYTIITSPPFYEMKQ